MRTFFGELVCECESLELVGYAMTGPDGVMEITGLHVICIDCKVFFHDSEDTAPSDMAAVD